MADEAPRSARGESAPARLLGPAEREAAIARLSAAFADDVLHIDEFERRVAEAYRVQNSTSLAKLVDDLPVPAPAPAPAPALGIPAKPAVPTARLGRKIASVFGNVERRGRVAVPETLKIDALFANVELDLRDAEFGAMTEINVESIFANVEIWLPDHVMVECHGDSMLGSFTSRAGRTRLPAGSAHGWLVRIKGHALFANVEIHGA